MFHWGDKGRCESQSNGIPEAPLPPLPSPAWERHAQALGDVPRGVQRPRFCPDRGMALRPSLTHPGPGAHAPLGSNDADHHNDEGEEAAGADAGQHHQQGDERLAAEAQAALAGGSSCRNGARAATGPSSPRDAQGHPTPVATGTRGARPTWAGRGPGWG